VWFDLTAGVDIFSHPSGRATAGIYPKDIFFVSFSSDLLARCTG
jgi:hypothetical protein